MCGKIRGKKKTLSSINNNNSKVNKKVFMDEEGT